MKLNPPVSLTTKREKELWERLTKHLPRVRIEMGPKEDEPAIEPEDEMEFVAPPENEEHSFLDRLLRRKRKVYPY